MAEPFVISGNETGLSDCPKSMNILSVFFEKHSKIFKTYLICMGFQNAITSLLLGVELQNWCRNLSTLRDLSIPHTFEYLGRIRKYYFLEIISKNTFFVFFENIDFEPSLKSSHRS